MELRSRIASVGAYVPENVVTNHDLEEYMETNDEWITQRTGIKKRYWVKGESTSDLALKASTEAIEKAGLQPEDIDMIIFATLSPDHDFPGTGCFLQAKLGIPEIPAFDIRQQCSGFIYGLSMADLYIRSGQYKNILLVGAEVHSHGLDKTTRGRDIAVLFGDGAGACVITATEVKDKNDSQIFNTYLHADGRFAKELWLPAPGSALGHGERINHAMLDEGLHFAQMNGKKVYVHAVKRMGEVVGKAIESAGYKIEDVDLFLFHQANLRINEAVAKHHNIPMDKVFNTIQDYGNTTAATIPIGMKEAVAAGRLKKGMLVATAAFGGGFTWAGGLLRY